jgi:hypothetical protein
MISKIKYDVSLIYQIQCLKDSAWPTKSNYGLFNWALEQNSLGTPVIEQ